MFDTYNARGATQYVPYEKTVTTNNAPTDASIALYEEIKEKAYKSILHSIIIENNVFSVSTIVYEDYLSFSVKAQYKFILNGKEYSNEFELEDYKIKAQGMDYVVDEIYKKVTHHIAVSICQPLLEKSSQHIRRFR